MGNALKNKFEGMAYGQPIEIEVDGETLELDIDADDIVPLMSIGGQNGEIKEDDVQRLTDTFRKILYRTYLPYWDEARDQEPASMNEAREEENEEVKQYVDGLLTRKLPVLINKMMTELGWTEEGAAAAGQDFQGGNLGQ